MSNSFCVLDQLFLNQLHVLNQLLFHCDGTPGRAFHDQLGILHQLLFNDHDILHHLMLQLDDRSLEFPGLGRRLCAVRCLRICLGRGALRLWYLVIVYHLDLLADLGVVLALLLQLLVQLRLPLLLLRQLLRLRLCSRVVTFQTLDQLLLLAFALQPTLLTRCLQLLWLHLGVVLRCNSLGLLHFRHLRLRLWLWFRWGFLQLGKHFLKLFCRGARRYRLHLVLDAFLGRIQLLLPCLRVEVEGLFAVGVLPPRRARI